MKDEDYSKRPTGAIHPDKELDSYLNEMQHSCDANGILVGKKIVFLSAVNKASLAIKKATPHVNFGGCEFSKHENAHIHIEQNLICVSESFINNATYEDLEHTAYHEVAHLLNETHNSEFKSLCVLLNTSLWEPPILQREFLDDFEREQLYNYIEEDLIKWGRVEIDENGEEYILKGRKLFKKYLKDELPNYKPRCILTEKVIENHKHNNLHKIDLSNELITPTKTCQFCFKSFYEVYSCPKCSLMLCEEHLSNHNCIKAQVVEDKHKVEPTPQLQPTVVNRPMSFGQKVLLMIALIGFLTALYAIMV